MDIIGSVSLVHLLTVFLPINFALLHYINLSVWLIEVNAFVMQWSACFINFNASFADSYM